MRLPDFAKCVEFQRLKEKMGVYIIPVLPPVEFTREVKVQKKVEDPNRAVIELEHKLRTENIPVTFTDITPDGEGLLTYKGRKVAAYIRDQKRGITPVGTTYRYHLCDCSTLRHMRAEGRERRYFVTKRDDGKFYVHDLSGSGYRVRKRVLPLSLCLNCVRELSMMGLHFTPFSLKTFFDKYDSKVPKTITRVITETTIQTYTPNQEDLSREYRKAAKYCCQLCHVDCSSDASLLHLHHRDGDASNNPHDNLRVLCVDCHSKQPYHGQVSQPARAQGQIKEIRRLRAEQGITELT